MKNFQNKLSVFLFILFTFPNLGSSQDTLPFELSCDVHANYPSLSMSKTTLSEADSIAHLYRLYKSSWIKEFISVEVFASHDGEIKKAVGKNDLLSQEQKDLMLKADFGSDISVKISYIPDNTLSHNDPKEFSFSFTVDPEKEAQYPGGQQQLKQYLKDNILDQVSLSSFNQHQLYAVKFTIDEDGLVNNPHVFWSSEDEKTDKILLESICNMPKWIPAAYANGNKVKQEFVLLIGDMKSCVLNLVNIRQNFFGE